MRWSERQTHLFVKLYLGNKCLWDTADEYYKSIYRRREAQRNIVTKFHALTNILIDERTVVNKIRSLRSTYRLELLKMRSRNLTKSSLRWFQDWHKCFRKHNIRIAKREDLEIDDQQDQEADTEEDTPKDWLADDVETGENNSDLDREPFLEAAEEEEFNVLLLKQEPGIVVDVPESSYIKPKKKKIKKKNKRFKLDESVEADSKSDPNEDEFDIYAKYIASQLRQMDIERALRVQIQIQSIVSEARIDSFSKAGQ